MTPVPLEMPLRLSEAAEIANLVFALAEGKALTDDLRGRLAARAAALKLSIKAHCGSLERDPVHRGSFYVAVDGQDGVPLLLHMALPTAPTSSIFEKPLLVGRTRRVNGPEVVINCVPFGPGDRENLDRFAKAYPAFLPRQQGMRTTVTVAAENPAAEFPRAFEAFGAVLRRKGRNVAAVAAPGAAGNSGYYAAVWAAARAGWREGYAVGVEVRSKDGLKELAGFSRFTMPDDRLYAAVRTVRRGFDFELAAGVVTPEDLGSRLRVLREAGHAAQLVAVSAESGASLVALAAVARQYQCMLSLRAADGMDAATRGIGPANWAVLTATEVSAVVERALG